VSLATIVASVIISEPDNAPWLIVHVGGIVRSGILFHRLVKDGSSRWLASSVALCPRHSLPIWYVLEVILGQCRHFYHGSVSLGIGHKGMIGQAQYSPGSGYPPILLPEFGPEWQSSKAEAKLSPCLIKHGGMKTWGRRGAVPHILNLSNRWRRQLSSSRLIQSKSRDTSVGIALGYGLDVWGSRAWFPARAGNFFLHHRVQNGSGAHPASYPVGTRGCFPGAKAGGAWSWPLTSILCQGHECVELYLHSQYVFMAWCLVKSFTFTHP
jgi:hypothetical protein